MNKITVIFPAAGIRNADELPYIFDKIPNGNTLLAENIKRLPIRYISAVFVVIPQFIEQKYAIRKLLQLEMTAIGCTIPLTVLELQKETNSEPETVAETIKQCCIKGQFLVKDPDNLFDFDDVEKNGVCIFPLDMLENVTPADKSYVEVDDNQYISNIIEKKIISRFFCTGGYFFEDADIYIKFYESIATQGQLYMSHVIYAMLLDKIPFRPVPVKSVIDLGSKKKWQIYKQKFATLFIDEKIAENNGTIINDLSQSLFCRIVITSANKDITEIEQRFKEKNINFHSVIGDVYTHHQIIITNDEQLKNIKDIIL
jgi:hypothetical protein